MEVAKNNSTMDKAAKKFIADFLFLMMNLLFFLFGIIEKPRSKTCRRAQVESLQGLLDRKDFCLNQFRGSGTGTGS
jgi:hypothetical protein